jgi:hypothetical protein
MENYFPELWSRGGRKMELRGGGQLERVLAWAVLLEFLALIAIHLFAIPVHIPRNYNEGWNAYFAQAAVQGGLLYPLKTSMLTNNYPPLSFYIVGEIGKMVGDNVVAGRLVAVLSLVVVAVNVFGLARWLGIDRPVALLSSGVFLLGTYTVMPGYIAINDPQFLSYAFVTSGGLAFLRADKLHLWRSMLLSALLMTLGGLVKHNEIALPLACCTWAAFYDRRRLSVFVVCALAVGGGAAALAYWGWGHAMVDAIFLGPKVQLFPKFVARLLQDLPFLVPYLLLAIAALMLSRPWHRAAFALSYLTWSLFTGCWMLSYYGVNQNVMCDAVIALALASSLFVTAVQRPFSAFFPGQRGHVLAILLMVLPVMASSLFVYLSNPRLRDMGEIVSANEWQMLYQTLSVAHGPVACENLAVCYWSRKPMEIDFFNYGQRIVTGATYVDAPSGFLAKVSQKSYAYVIVETNPFQPSLLPPMLVGALFQNYKPMEWVAGKELVLVPKT